MDTCVISELIKVNPNANVITWINNQPEERLFLSTITIGEIQEGISKLNADSRKKVELKSWLHDELIRRFDKRILGVDVKVALKWGEIQASAENSGSKMPAIDGLIAAIGRAHEMTVATRNTRDMEAGGVRLYNPWETNSRVSETG